MVQKSIAELLQQIPIQTQYITKHGFVVYACSYTKPENKFAQRWAGVIFSWYLAYDSIFLYPQYMAVHRITFWE
jgi:hypothetical protein